MKKIKKFIKPQQGRSGSKVTKNSFVTRSGKIQKINRSFFDKLLNGKDLKAQRRAKRLATLPKGRVKRILYHLSPKRMYHYWFSRDGVIMALKLVGLGIVVGSLLLVGALSYFRKDLPNLKDISGKNIGGSVRYYDRTGQTLLWEDYDAVKRIPVANKDISKFMQDATVAVEDKDFFNHGGFDVKGILRAGINNAFGSNSTQGGSTITQQLVKLTQDWSKDRTYTRKIKELILSVELERSYSKQEILTGYLNAAPYGGIEYGVEAAARDYFQKSAKDLTLPEAAMLATIPKSPRYYSPYSDDFDKALFIGRKDYILTLLEQQHKITKKEHDDAKKVDVLAEVKPRQPKYAGIKAPWFVLAAKKQLEDTRGEQSVKLGGWTITTTLDMKLQTLAEQQVANGMAQIRRQGGDVAAFAAEDVKTGQMVALVGGSDFTNTNYGQINFAQTPLPPGSSFKPYDYTALIDNTTNVGAGSVLYDSQDPLEGYPCTNKANPKQGGNCLHDYDFRYPGPLTLRYALGGSRNVPAVKAMLTVGVDKTIKTGEKLMDPRNGSTAFGYNCYYDVELSNEGPCFASSGIGDGAFLHLDQHVHGYASISRNGLNISQTYIMKITDSNNKVIDEWKPTKGDQVVKQDSAYIVADMLSDPNASYFSTGRKPHRYRNSQGTWNFAMKTGTTNDGKDAWMMGFSTQYAAGVWVGYHDRGVVMSGGMENMTQPIWDNWMKKAHENLKPEDRQRPNDIQTLPAFVVRSHVGVGSIEPSPENDLYPGWYKPNAKTSGAPKILDSISNKLATDCTPDKAKKTVTDTLANTFSADRFASLGANGNTEEKDDVHLCDDIKPSLDALVLNSSGIISTTAHQGTHPLNSDTYKAAVNFIANGQVLQSFAVNNDGQTMTFDTSDQPAGTVISAQIIDSVLYDTTSPNTVTTDVIAFNLVVTPTGGNNYKFSWTNLPSGSPYQLCISTNSSSYACSAAISGDQRSVSGSSRKAYVKANTSAQSNTKSF